MTRNMLLGRRLLALTAPVLMLAAIALGLYWRSPATTHGTGTPSLDGLAAIVNFSFAGPCNPGALAAPPSGGTNGVAADESFPHVVAVSAPVNACISRAGCPETIMVGNERFLYANVSALIAGAPGTQVIPVGTPGPYVTTLAAVNLPDAPDPNPLNCAAQRDYPGNFPSAGDIFINDERFSYNGVDASGFHLTNRYGKASHFSGNLIRAANRIELQGRGVPKYPALSTPTPYAFPTHVSGEAVHSPKTYNTCRVLLSQQGGGTNPVTATSACYYIQEPGFAEDLCPTPAVPAPAPCFWPLGGMPQDYQQDPTAPVQHWTSVPGGVQDNGSTTTVTLVGPCVPYLEGPLTTENPTGVLSSARMQMTLRLIKAGKTYSGTDGSTTNAFAIKVYETDNCDSVGANTPVPTPVQTLTDAAPNIGASLAPNMFLKCAADVQGSSAHALCYFNSLTTTNNKPGNGGSANCPAANLKFCGDAIFAAPGCAQSSQLATPVQASCLALPAATPSRHDCAGLGTQSTDPQVVCDVSQWQYLHVDKSMTLVVTVDNPGKVELRYGCIEDAHGHQPLGAVYVDTLTVDPATGHGTATVWYGPSQTNAQCVAAANAHSTSGLSGMSSQLPVQVVLERGKSAGANAVVCDGGSGHPQPVPGTTNQCRNGDSFGTCFDPAAATTLYCRDSDGDGCFDKDELQSQVGSQTNVDVAKWGGMRDPQNPYDYPDMPVAANKHKIRVDDVTYVVNRFRHDMNLLPAPSSNPYDPKADHAVLPGNNAGETWHLGPPNGQIRVDDVTAVVNSFRHDCN